jgi:hypothetical protein
LSVTTVAEPRGPTEAERRNAAERWAGFVDKTPKAADIGARGSAGIRHFTDATGATILENADGRFKLDRYTGKYERIG